MSDWVLIAYLYQAVRFDLMFAVERIDSVGEVGSRSELAIKTFCRINSQITLW